MIEAVSLQTGVHPRDILSTNASRPVCVARWLIMRELYGRTDANGRRRHGKAEVGRAIGRDHSTVLYGLRKLDAVWASIQAVTGMREP